MGFEVIDFYFFSGTGNTYRVVKKMVEVFQAQDIVVNLYRIEKQSAEKIDLSHTIGLAFPVAAQATYRFVWDFIEDLPDATGTKIFMVDTMAGMSGAIVGPLKKFLKSVGYDPIGSKEIIMPSNFLPKEIDQEKDELKIKKGLEEAEKYAKDLIEGKAVWRDQTFFADLFSSVVKGKFCWEFFAKEGEKFRVDEEKCTKCHLCEKLCPTGNIELNEYPRFYHRCQQCMRCISFCPTGALYIPKRKYQTYKAVKAGELLNI